MKKNTATTVIESIKCYIKSIFQYLETKKFHMEMSEWMVQNAVILFNSINVISEIIVKF